MRERLARVFGMVGAVVCIVVFARNPSFPTPDKILIFGILIAMIFCQAIELTKRFVPFVAVLIAYEAFRGLVPALNSRVSYEPMINADKLLFGGHLPTIWLQSLLWHGNVTLLEFGLYFTYMLHFVLPLLLAVVIWKKHAVHYWRVVVTYAVVSFMGFMTFLLYPASPPWLAYDHGYIQGNMTRISSDVWSSMGIVDFPSLYNRISPNPVAAVPSLHAAYATLLAIFVWKVFGRKWGMVATVYPALIYFGTVYMGEHYVVDELLGSLYAAGAYYAAPYVLRAMNVTYAVVSARFSPEPQTEIAVIET